jgi:hypothetical protein
MGLLLAPVFSSRAEAAPYAPDIPGIEICPKEAPFAATPESGLAGLLGERPIQITTDNSPEHIWSTGGFAGLRSHTYDLGCAMDPTSWSRVTYARMDSSITNAITSFSDSVVALTDSVDRRAWQPGWVISFLQDFAQRAVGIVNTTIMVPFLMLGLIATTGVLLWRAHHGDISATSSAVGWSLVVIVVSGLLIMAPLMVAKGAQMTGGTIVAGLNNGANPSDSATNQIVKNVQYQGWLRRNFGSTQTLVGTKYGPELLASTRVSWAELDRITALPPSEQPEARKKLTDQKAEQFKELAEKIKDEDPIAYRYVTGEESGSAETLVEVLFVLASCLFRLATAVLMVVCTITLVLLDIIWLVTTPVLVIPYMGRFSGQEMGMGLAESAVRALGYVLAAAVGSWLFGIYLQAAMAPGMTLWWSLLLLILGSGIAWTVIRPDRKFLSVVSLGRVDGYGYVGRLVANAAIGYFTGRIAGRTAAREVLENDDEPTERLSENIPQPQVRTVHANIYTPTQPFVPERPTTVDADPLPGTIIHPLPSGIPAYERPTGEASQPTPPPDGSSSPYAPYERTDDTEGADHG